METYTGTVEKGSRKASALGFPTINIPVSGLHSSGSYAARVEIGSKAYEAAAYVDSERGVVEAHLFGFSESAYGQMVSITLMQKIRDKEEFTSDELLRQAIADDVQKAKAYFKHV